jgi:uncharacterized membrane protein
MTNEPVVAQTDGKTWAMIVWGCYILGAVTGFLAIVGVILAYVKRNDLVGTPFDSHMVSAIRTFWISLIVGLVGFLLLIVGIGFVILLALGVWVLFRSIRGLIFALDSKPIADPKGWL